MSTRIPPSLDDADTDLPVRALTWFVIWAAVRAERKVADAIQALDHQVYLPVSVHWSRRGVGRRQKPRVKVERPLLDRYLIVGLENPEEWPVIRRLDGVEKVVGKLDKPGIDAMFEMKAQQALGLWDETLTIPFEVGQTVRLTESAGQFADWNGRIEKLERGEKARVELWNRMLGRFVGTPITVSLDDLEAVA